MRGAGAVLGRWAGILLSLAGLAAVAFVVADDWALTRRTLADADPVLVLAALAAAASGMSWIALMWRLALRAIGADLPTGRTISLYYRGEIAKYVPGGVWAVLGRSELARRAGIPGPTSYGSVALSLGGLYAASALVASAFLWAGPGAGWASVAVLVLLPLAAIAVHPRVLGVVRGAGTRVLRRPLELPVPGWGTSLVLIVAYAPAWFGIGTATWLAGEAIGADASWAAIMLATPLSWLAGFVVVPAPGGLGIREAVFVALVGLPPSIGAAVAVAARLVFVLVDGTAATAAWLAEGRTLVPRRHRRP